MAGTVVTRVLRAMGHYEPSPDGGIVVSGNALMTTRDEANGLQQELASGDLNERLAILEHRLDAAFELVRALERERDELLESNAALAAAVAEQAGATERLGAAEQALDERTRRCEELEAEVDRLRGAQPIDVEPEPEASAHLAFVACVDGYRLVDCPGPPPPAGSIVELPAETGVSGRQLVVRIGTAHLPGPPMRCAYLLSLG